VALCDAGFRLVLTSTSPLFRLVLLRQLPGVLATAFRPGSLGVPVAEIGARPASGILSAALLLAWETPGRVTRASPSAGLREVPRFSAEGVVEARGQGQQASAHRRVHGRSPP